MKTEQKQTYNKQWAGTKEVKRHTHKNTGDKHYTKEKLVVNGVGAGSSQYPPHPHKKKRKRKQQAFLLAMVEALLHRQAAVKTTSSSEPAQAQEQR